MALGDRIKKYRTSKRLSLQELADMIGASKAHIWELETGRARNPSLDLITKLASCFGVGVADLVGENPNAPGEKPELVAMFRDLKGLNEKDLKTVQSMMEHFRKQREE
jgi:transcriptional regulator with XRE-family HTH domain